jgi:stearoyl-CoA desaturase (Delta-9 desaturase)
VITGLGVTVGFHRLLTHRSFTAAPALRVALAIAGSMSFEGEVIGWVAIHRRHHAFSDRPGDPHSPYRYGTSVGGQLRGLAHAHAGWLLRDDPTPTARYAPDMVADPAMRAISAAFPALCALSLALPFGAGWLIGGTWRTALAALLWAGLVRVAVLQHVTWSVNSPRRATTTARPSKSRILRSMFNMGFLHYRAARGSGFTGEVCETVPERTVLLDGGAEFLGSRVFALPGG